MNPAYRDERIATLVREYGADRVLEEVIDLERREGRGSEADDQLKIEAEHLIEQAEERAKDAAEEKAESEIEEAYRDGLRDGKEAGKEDGYAEGFDKAKRAIRTAVESCQP